MRAKACLVEGSPMSEPLGPDLPICSHSKFFDGGTATMEFWPDAAAQL